MASTPAAQKAKTPKSTDKRTQSSLLGFFQKSAGPASSPASSTNGAKSPLPAPKFTLNGSSSPGRSQTTRSVSSGPPSSPLAKLGRSNKITEDDDEDEIAAPRRRTTALTSSPVKDTPRRRNRKIAFDDSDSDDAAITPTTPSSSGRLLKKIRPNLADMDSSDVENDDSDFCHSDHSEEEPALTKPSQRKKKAKSGKSAPPTAKGEPDEPVIDFGLDDHPQEDATVLKWNFDPAAPQQPVNVPKPRGKPSGKVKAHMTEPELRYSWLANVRDADKNSPGDPEYDPRTLYIPPSAWAKFSPFEKQYWEVKQKFWDTIVFFKKGKFYELYENDATVGSQLFDFKLTDRVNMRMAGVPEATLDQWANQFVAKGYKIARVDQVESALAKQMRERGDKSIKLSKEDKVIKRELAAVFTAGTLTETGMIQTPFSTYCVAIKEGPDPEQPYFGVSFVDAASARFYLCEIEDDGNLSKFETLVAQLRPTEILLEKGRISSRAMRILKNNTSPTALWNQLKPGKEFWFSDETLHEINQAGYFVTHKNGAQSTDWPPALEAVKGNELVMSSVGALLYYLRSLKIDKELLAIGNIEKYDPLMSSSHLVLDGKSLVNLEIFANSVDGGVEGTVFQLIDRAVTPFGKRLIRQWTCHPLVDVSQIKARQDAVFKFMENASERARFHSTVALLPDLERLLSRIHVGRCKGQDFLKAIEGFEIVAEAVQDLGEIKGGIIDDLVKSMPDMDALLKDWKTAFDREEARKSGSLVPAVGVEEDYDESRDRIKTIEAALDAVRLEWQTKLKSRAIDFRDNGKEIYQLEVPVSVKGVPKDWDQMSATGKVKRYYFPKLRSLVRDLQEARETHGQVEKKVSKRMFSRFVERYRDWMTAINVVAHLDCLASLSKTSDLLGMVQCRPEFVTAKRTALDFEELYHPCVGPQSKFIPNDIHLGGDNANFALLTGANAAGKSTVLRMTCVAVIFAQLGMMVPAREARLTPVDRIITRLGANDALFAGQSTFFVELAETRKILAEATPRSLVILDELGRGTSSVDGIAVAGAVLHQLATWTGCVGVFATHYRDLVAEFAFHPEIVPKRMRISVDEAERRVTFLYKLEDGVAEGSFGMHCAAMCGIPGPVIDRAEQAAEQWAKLSRFDGVEEIEDALPLGVVSDVVGVLEGLDEKMGVEVLARALERVL